MCKEFFNFIELWKERYDHFVMDRVIFKDEDEIQHLFAYIYPKALLDEDEMIKDYIKNQFIEFERIKLKTDEVIELVKNFKINPDEREMTITYPDGLKYTFKTEQFVLQELIKAEDTYGKIGIYVPCYRLMAKSQNSIFNDNEFSTVSKIGYSNVLIAAKDIFKHRDIMFSKENYPSDVNCPLVIDLSHFEWNIQRFEQFRNIVEIEINNLSKKEIKKPIGVLNVEFTSGEHDIRIFDFVETETQEAFPYNIANVDFYLQSHTNAGFKGDKNSPKSGGNILDHRSIRKHSIQSQDFINLEDLSKSELRRLIKEKENDTVEFKSVLEENITSSHYREIGKQMTSMANAKAKGLVIIGVTKTGIIEGVGESTIEEFMNNLQQTLDSNCDPWIDFIVKEYKLLSQNKKKLIFVVSLLADLNKRPYLYRKGKSTYDMPLRRGDTTKWLSSKEIKEYMIEIFKEKNKNSWP